MQHTPVVEVVSVSKRYGQRLALDTVTFDVAAGSVFVLLGANGAGKTTLTRCMTTLTRFDSGTIRVAGHDTRTHPHRVRANIGLVSQFPTLDETLTVTANLRTIADLMRMSATVARARMGEVIETLGLTDVQSQVVQTLSGGYRRRVDLAVSLLGSPKVLFLDEPTAGLDFPSRVQLWEILRQRCSDGLTIVLTTQDLSEAEDMATDGLILRSGEIAARGTVEQLRTRAGSANMQLTFANASAASAAVALIGATDATLDTTGRQVSVMTGNTLADSNAILERLEQLAEPPLEISIGPPPLSELIMRLGDNAQVGATHA